MNHSNDHMENPQSDVYVELSAVRENKIQQGIIFSEVNSLKQDCEILYEPHEDTLDPGIYSFDLFYEPNITVDSAEPEEKNLESKSTQHIILKLKKS